MDRLCAFSYQPQEPEKDLDSWSVYDARREYKRMGIGGEKAADNGWRISNLNSDYSVRSVHPDLSDMLTSQFSPTYPKFLVVPSSISDNTLRFAVKFRSKARLPVLTYLHSVNNCSITRCSQPMVGLRQSRSIQDEKLLLAIYSATNARTSENLMDTAQEISSLIPQKSPAAENEDNWTTSIRTPSDPFTDANEINNFQPESFGDGHDPQDVPELSHSDDQTPAKNESHTNAPRPDMSFIDIEAAEDELMANGEGSDSGKPLVYGAQRHNLIVDARPIINAVVMTAAGMGSEIMDNYPFAKKVYLGIENIHVMRNSLEMVVDTLKDSDITSLGPNKQLLAKSEWTKHIANMLDGVGIIVRQVGIQSSSVVIHCSDGWDRTSQLSALSQLCLDPYYRTLEGFMVLVEKDWLSFGHMFATRSGYLSSEKWFTIEKERSFDSHRNPLANRPAGAIEDAFLKAKSFFRQEPSKSRESLVESESEGNAGETLPQGSASPGPGLDRHQTKVKEVAPMFHQFLDATYQLLYQNPNRFEFNERFLRRLLYHLYSCQYGTFLYNSERERDENDLNSRTRSVWDYFLSRRTQFVNLSYDPEINDMERDKERLILPRPVETRWWSEAFGREDHEMNGAPIALSNANSNVSDSIPVPSDNSAVDSDGRFITTASSESAERKMSVTAAASTSKAAVPSPSGQPQTTRLGSGASPFARFESSSGPVSQTPTKSNVGSVGGPAASEIEDEMTNLHLGTNKQENRIKSRPFSTL